MKGKINQSVVILVLSALLFVSVIFNFLHLSRINELSEDVFLLHAHQAKIEAIINHLHDLDGEGNYGN